jgi:hypothetical protein
MPKKPPRPPILLQQRLPFQGQTWVDAGVAWEFGTAYDELALPEPRPFPGTLLRAVERRSVIWAGVADAGGAVLPLPSMHRVDAKPERGVSTWFQAWDGPRARVKWMLEAAGRVDRSLHVATALAALAPLTPRRGPEEFNAGVAALRAWLRGEGSVEAVVEAEQRLVNLDRSDRFGRAEQAARAACNIVIEPVPGIWTRDALNEVLWIVARPDGQGSVEESALLAALLAQKENIRANIPLGLVILSYVEDVRADLERRAARRNYRSLG